MHGVNMCCTKRAGIDAPILPQTIVDAGDIVELMGTEREVDGAAKKIGYTDRPADQTDMIFVSLGVLIGGLIDALNIHIGDVPINLSTSEGALIGGLFFGWLRSKHLTLGHIPEPALWILDNVSLNMFTAVVGIVTGPSFVQGFEEVGLSLSIIGALATFIPPIVGILMGKYLSKSHPALILRCIAGAHTTTAALGVTQEVVESETLALGYIVTYTVRNTLLIIWGVIIALLI